MQKKKSYLIEDACSVRRVVPSYLKLDFIMLKNMSSISAILSDFHKNKKWYWMYHIPLQTLSQ